MTDNDYLPENILVDSWISAYWKQHQILYKEIYNLNSYLHIIEILNNFPFSLFSDLENLFWEYTYLSMCESSIMIINRVYIDEGKDVLTLNKFKK